MNQYQYNFLSESLADRDVRKIIGEAGYEAGSYTLKRVNGWQVTGTSSMNVSLLEKSANDLQLPSAIRFVPPAKDTQYSLSFSMNSTTVTELQSQGMHLVGFKGVTASMIGNDVAPTIWFESTTYATNTSVSWAETYSAYTTQTDIESGVTIIGSNQYPINMTQTLNITSNAGVGSVVNGTKQNISIDNQTSTPFTVGLEQQVSGNAAVMCAFRLHGHFKLTMVPQERVLLMFATDAIDAGEVVLKAESQGILVNLGISGTNPTGITYDIDKGWAWGGQNWAQSVAEDADLSPLLIQPQ
jgi:hypothetical protein